MKKHMINALLLAVVLVVSSACGHRKVTRIDTDKTIDLSGRWNDTDSRLTANAMIDQCLNQQWLMNFSDRAPGKKPVVIVGFVENNTDEHIQAEPFILDLEKAFINSGRVRLVSGGEKRDEIRKERAQQQDYASQSTMKSWGQEIGADYMLQGDISSIIDSYGKEKVRFYQVNLKLTDIETTEVVWIGDKKIKKYVKN